MDVGGLRKIRLGNTSRKLEVSMTDSTPTTQSLLTLPEILAELAPHAILVGSASRRPLDECNDIDLLISQRGLQRAKKVIPQPWGSLFPGNIYSRVVEPSIEVFVYWYGPGYNTLKRRKGLKTK